MHAARWGYKESFECFWDYVCEIFEDRDTREELLMQRNHKGESVFHLAMLNHHDKTFEFVTDIYLETLRKENLQEFIAVKVGSENVFYGLLNYQGFWRFKFLWDFLLKLFEGEESKFKQILLQKNEQGKTFYEDVKEKCFFDSIFKELLHFIEIHFSDNEKKQIGFVI